jgi:adenylate kinase family enzyme
MTSKDKLIILIGGYANSGKSTFMQFAEELGCNTYSSSVLLHSVYQKIALRFYGEKIDSLKKNDLIYTWLTPNELGQVTIREDLINLAENILVETFSRGIFASAIVDQILCKNDSGKAHVIETFGDVELDYLEYYLQTFLPTAVVIRFNIRRQEENPSADSRKLLTSAFDIVNTGTKEQYKEIVFSHLNHLISLYLG